jgi:hypothetical protein
VPHVPHVTCGRTCDRCDTVKCGAGGVKLRVISSMATSRKRNPVRAARSILGAINEDQDELRGRKQRRRPRAREAISDSRREEDSCTEDSSTDDSGMRRVND